MTEKRTLTEEQQKLKEKFSDELRGELNRPGSGKPTLEEFKKMVYEDRERRKLKNRIKKLFSR